MTYSDGTIDRIEATFKELADEVNRTSASTRNGWVFFLALQAYFFVALAGITHRDLLLDTPISLPLLQVRIGLKEFFLFGPIILVLVHMGILLQHVMLARQARELHSRLTSFEGKSFFRTHRIRIHLHSYFFTQLIAGGQRSAFFAFFLSLMTWLSLGILPVVLLMDFQTTFLPYHDLQVTWAQRAYLVADVVILTIFAMFMRHPALGFVAGFGRTILERPISFLISFALGIGAMFFSLNVATVPDEDMDRAMTAVWPTSIPDFRREGAPPRQAFWLTARLFDGGIDRLSGRPASMFGRNLVVTDTDLVKDGAFDEGESSINLRLRDLRYGTFDRSDMHQADFTGANLARASLREVNLVETKAEQAIFRGADLRGANLANANLQGARLDGALLEGTNLQGASLEPAVQAEATRQGAKF